MTMVKKVHGDVRQQREQEGSPTLLSLLLSREKRQPSTVSIVGWFWFWWRRGWWLCKICTKAKTSFKKQQQLEEELLQLMQPVPQAQDSADQVIPKDDNSFAGDGFTITHFMKLLDVIDQQWLSLLRQNNLVKCLLIFVVSFKYR